MTDLQALNGTVVEMSTKMGELALCLDYLWLLVCGALVMFMQAGFAILETGSCRQKNAGTLLMKNMMDVCLGTICWYLLGYGFAYGAGDDTNSFMGTQNFAGSGFMTTKDGALTGTGHFKDWFFQWAFCATAATIVSGAVAERIQFTGYIVYSLVMCAIIYPIIVWWTWSGNGFLTQMGYSDFAGSGIVHLTGGISALVGAAVLGPRTGRWERPESFDPHNMGLVVLGTFILWFGWYGFNCGSTLAFSDASTATQAALVAMNTTLSAAIGGLTVFVARWLRTGKYDLGGTCNGVLAGLVAVCAGVGDVMPYSAIVIGILGALGHELASVTLKKLKIDDPLDAFAVHGASGIVGVLLRPLLDRTGAKGAMFGAHCVAILCIIAWSGGISLVTFGALKAAGKLRVSEEEETKGADEHMAQSYQRSASPKVEAKTTTEQAV